MQDNDAEDRTEMARLSAALDRLLTKMQDDGNVTLIPFTPEEIEQIKRGAKLVQWVETLGWLGKQLMAVIAALVLLLSQWERIMDALGIGK